MSKELLGEIISRYFIDLYNVGADVALNRAYEHMKAGKVTKWKSEKPNVVRVDIFSGLSIARPVQGEWSRHQRSELDAHAKDVLQPLKKDGTVNKHFVEAHGTKSLEKEWKVPRQKIMEDVQKYG